MSNKKNNFLKSKKFLIGFIAVIIGCVILGAYTKPSSTIQDIPYKARDYRSPRVLNFDLNNIPIIGKSTEEDVYNIYGTDVDRRLTFKQNRQRTIQNTTFTYNKIIQYEYTEYDYYSEQKGDLHVSGGTVVAKTEIIVYLLDGKVTFFAGKHQPRVNDEFIKPDRAINLSPNNAVWPQAEQDIADYRAQ